MDGFSAHTLPVVGLDSEFSLISMRTLLVGRDYVLDAQARSSGSSSSTLVTWLVR